MSNDRFLKACRREPVDCTPVWFMRQAGRYLTEYRKLREKYDLLTIAKTPGLCAQVTLLPVRKFELDAAILFADIMLPLEAMGVNFELKENIGPVIHNPIRRCADVEALRVVEPEEAVPFVLEAIRLIRSELRVPLIGFSGAPFTLASYLIEGSPSRTFVQTKSLMYREPATWHQLMERLTQLVLEYLRAQVRAGVQAVQLFDSWVGCLSPQDYQEYVLPYSRRIFEGLADLKIPRIHFGTDTATLLELMRAASSEVIGVDWRIPLDRAWERIGKGYAIQGNLDPATLLGPWKLVQERTREILQQVEARPGHIFNLGHGFYPDTPVENVARLVEFVHEQTSNKEKARELL
ncbi:uroporphyrinogen decarboxylase [Candidatus Acetothermia bacterium]|nr:uroporphyrinogen decarboxylase [Candidatus Acetothermia bacterium]